MNTELNAFNPSSTIGLHMRFQAVFITITSSLALTVVSMIFTLIPLMFLDAWYLFNCNFHDGCVRFGTNGVSLIITEIRSYFLHSSPLSDYWSVREKIHLKEVRDIYRISILMLIVVIVWLLIIYKINRVWINSALKIAILNTACLAMIIIPLFGYFWTELFHEFLFDNTYWQTRKGEIFWSLTPPVFFLNSVICMFCLSIAINWVLLRVLR